MILIKIFFQITLQRVRHLKWKFVNKTGYFLIRLPIGKLIPTGQGSFRIYKTNLGTDGQIIFLKVDQVMANYVNKYGYWDIEICNELAFHINQLDGKTAFIDVGANQGLIAIQVSNKLIKADINFILIEPSLELFNNLARNISLIKIDTDLHQFGLGDRSDSNSTCYKSRRNATTTQFRDAIPDSEKDLVTEKIKICSVDEFNQYYGYFQSYKNIVIKSDTDGNDITIFNSFMGSNIRQKISFYVLEVLLIDDNSDKKQDFFRNLKKFSSWTLNTREGHKITDKEKILNVLKTKTGIIGDLYLFNNLHSNLD